MALATISGPLLGGVIVDTSWLGWRWTFFIGVPIALGAFVLLQKTLHLAHLRRDDRRIDYAGASLIAVGVSALLIWITFVGRSFPAVSWRSAVLVLPAVAVLVAATWVERRAAQPVVPLDVVRLRVSTLAILASVSIGMAIFGGAVFLSLYFQNARGYSPTEAGLLMIPLMVGVFGTSAVTGQLVSRTGRIKPYVVGGAAALLVGNAVLGFIGHATPLWILAVGMLLVGVGVGMSMQNLVLAVQNAVPLSEVGAASGAVAFFRSLGGTAGVAVLGAAFGTRVASDAAENLGKAGIPVPAGGAASVDPATLAEPAREILHAAYGAATGHIFLISAGIAAVGLVAALLMPRVVLRTTLDLPPADDAPRDPPVAGRGGAAASGRHASVQATAG
jgi:MFS family permease